MKLNKYISPLVPSQFPSFYGEDGQNFVAFVQTYYQWLEQPDNYLYKSRSALDNFDIDETITDYLKYYKRLYAAPFPAKHEIDTRTLIKFATDLYLAVGTSRAIELLFRMVFNEDVTVEYPGERVFKTSDGTWVVPRHIEVSDSEYLVDLIGKQIYSGSGIALVESLATKVIRGKLINVLYISNVQGTFKFNEKVYCDDLYVHSTSRTTISSYEYTQLSTANKTKYSKAITFDNAPVIFGSLSTIAITNGGAGFSVGDLLSVYGSGEQAIAKVTSVRNENGKVLFSLVDGGFGFSVNAIVTVSGGGGTSATFKVGGIANKRIYRINSDDIESYYSTQMDVTSSGIRININTSSGAMTIGETITATGNTVVLDVEPVDGYISNGHTVSNTSIGVTGLRVVRSEQSYLQLTGNATQLQILADLDYDALAAGIVLVSSGGATTTINTVFPLVTSTANAIVTDADTSRIYCNFVEGYFVPNTVITGVTSAQTANVASVIRESNWMFPKVVTDSNLDSPNIGDTLTVFDLEVGTITHLNSANPGRGYSSDPSVDVVEPYIYDLRIPDEIRGGYYGHNATIEAKASNANGIVTSVDLFGSGFGYEPSETLLLMNNNNITAVTAKAVIDQHGVSPGYWTDNKGFLSDKIYLQDSDYYQSFSYEIVAPRMKSTYEQMVNSIVHPVGFKMFGKFVVTSAVGSDQSSTNLTFTSTSS